MRTIQIIFILLLISLSTMVFGGTTPITAFSGDWVNMDLNATDLKKMTIDVNSGRANVSAYGNCGTSACHWGTERGNYFQAAGHSRISANYKLSSGLTQQIVMRKEGAIIIAKVHTTYPNGRTPKTTYHKMKRKTVASSSLNEDCVSFNPQNLTIGYYKGKYIVKDGTHYVFSAPTKEEAKKIITICQYYGFNQSCFVGRANPSFTYLLKNGRAVNGSMANEDSITFNPLNIHVKRINSRWKIVDGSNYIRDFGNNKAEAYKAYKIIKKYGFRNIKYVGRPNPSFTYLTK